MIRIRRLVFAALFFNFYCQADILLEEITFDSKNGHSTANITLDDQTEWVAELSFENQIALEQWLKGDHIDIDANKNRGLTLRNTSKTNSVVCFPSPSCQDGFKKIIDIRMTKGGWCSNDNYYIKLNDGSYWKVIFHVLSYRWQVGQRVVMPHDWLLINVDIEWREGYRDDRSIMVGEVNFPK